MSLKFHTSLYTATTMTVHGICEVTGKFYSVKVTPAAYHRWKYGGQLLQDAFPELSVPEREFILSGTTPAEWDKMFNNVRPRRLASSS